MEGEAKRATQDDVPYMVQLEGKLTEDRFVEILSPAVIKHGDIHVRGGS